MTASSEFRSHFASERPLVFFSSTRFLRAVSLPCGRDVSANTSATKRGQIVFGAIARVGRKLAGVLSSVGLDLVDHLDELRSVGLRRCDCVRDDDLFL